jgi:sec-independent protein translocase protein TatA
MFGLGTTELVLILFIAVLVFGGSRLPALGKGLGEGIRSFRNALKGEVAPGEKEIDKSEK